MDKLMKKMEKKVLKKSMTPAEKAAKKKKGRLTHAKNEERRKAKVTESRNHWRQSHGSRPCWVAPGDGDDAHLAGRQCGHDAPCIRIPWFAEGRGALGLDGETCATHKLCNVAIGHTPTFARQSHPRL